MLDGKRKILQEPTVVELLHAHKISFPGITKDRLMDRSKTDSLAKFIAIGQTAWFMAQVISRSAQRLPISELELATAAFALLNVLIYILWWDKPKNVRFPVMVPLLQEDRPSIPHTQSISVQAETHDEVTHLFKESQDTDSFLVPCLGAYGSETSSMELWPVLACDSPSLEPALPLHAPTMVPKWLK